MNITLDENQLKVFTFIGNKLKPLIENSIQELLNTKHLYQNINISFPDSESVYKEIAPELAAARFDLKTIKPFYDQLFQITNEVAWGIINPNRRLSSFFTGGQGMRYVPSIEISPKTIKCFCHNCDEIEPYNFVFGGDVIHDPIDDPQNVQVFALAYECQGCKSYPEVFLVRRKGTKIILSGRSPIEQVIVAKQIPKSHKEYISNAMIAYNSGVILAGIFYLRVFIEQYIRSKSKIPNNSNIESLFEEYSSGLPDAFKSSFPSLKSIYEDLSNSIHSADPSIAVFELSLEKIEHHFEGKKAFRIDN